LEARIAASNASPNAPPPAACFSRGASN